jgi:FixJ family two-component response regulator
MDVLRRRGGSGVVGQNRAGSATVTSEVLIRVIDDDASVRRALRRLIEASGRRVREFASADEFLGAPRDDSPGCLVLDLLLPGSSGLELQEALRADGRCLPVVFLSGHGDVPTTVRAMRGGAVDFLQKPVDGAALLAAIDRALEQDAAERARRRSSEEIRDRLARLSERERQVLAGIVEGRLNKQIAGRLGIAERTVKYHRAGLMTKLGATSVADLVRDAAHLRGLDDAAPSSGG